MEVGTPSCTDHHLINGKVEMNKMPVSQNLLQPERQGVGQSKFYALECSPIKAQGKTENTFVEILSARWLDLQIYFSSHSPLGTLPFSW